MGLDMTLYAKKYYSSYSDKEMRDKLEKTIGKKFQSCEVSCEVGYWRKANQIHKWFVDVCGKGEDNCEDMEVSREALQDLKDLCEKIIGILDKQERKKVKLKEKFSDKEYEHEIYPDTKEIEELLPTQEGFFFGGYEYDEYYKTDLENTIEIIDKCFKEYENDWYFSYRASW